MRFTPYDQCIALVGSVVGVVLWLAEVERRALRRHPVDRLARRNRKAS